MWGTMRHVNQTQGFSAFWRGNGANLVRIIPNKAVLFCCNDKYKSTLKRMTGRDRLTKLQKFLCGAMSGLTVAVTTYPLDLVRTRLCAQEGLQSEYRGIADCFMKTLKREGAPGLYRGLVPTIAGIMPYCGQFV